MDRCCDGQNAIVDRAAAKIIRRVRPQASSGETEALRRGS